MATPNLIQQGVLVSDNHVYSPNTHINSANLFNAAIKNTYEMDNIGLVTTWAQMFRNVQPLYNFNEIAKDVMQVESSNGFTWSTATAMENPRVVEDLSDTDKPGIDGQEFRVAFDRPFSVTTSISYDHIMNDVQLLVVQEPYKDGDRWIHTVKLLAQNSKNKYLSKEFLIPGTQYYDLSGYRGDEFDDVAGSIRSEVGERTWHYRLGNSEVASDFHITKKALLELKAGKHKGSDLRIWQLYKFAKDSEAYNYMLGDPQANLSKVFSEVYKKDKNAMSKDIKATNWFYEIEKVTMDDLMRKWIMNLMWGVGGQTQIQTDTFSVAPGLYWQHRNLGNVVHYNRAQMSLDFLRNKIEQHFVHRMDFNQEGTIILKMGSGAYDIIEADIRKEYNQVGLITDQTDRFLQGDRFHLNFAMRFDGFYLKRFPQVKVLMIHEPALDPLFGNDISNPIIDRGGRLSSYSIILYDLNDIEKDNIKLVKWKYDDKMRYQKFIGNIDWNDQNSTFVSSGNFSGMKGVMSMRHAGMWLVDPTKSLMFEMINPYR